ncbi:MAG: cadherin domain-containing protein [Rubripirellula sp.]
MLASLGGEVYVDADGDGQRGPTEVGAVAIRVYVDANDNGAHDPGELFSETDSQGQYSISGLPGGDYVVRVETPLGQAQTSPTAYFGAGYPVFGDGNDANPTQLFEMSLDGNVRPIGTQSGIKIHDVVRTNSGELLGVSFLTDSIYSLDIGTGQETLLGISSQSLVAGLAHDPATDTVYTLAREVGTADTYRLHAVDQSTGLLGPAIGPGLSGLNAVSDLAFDTVNQRIIGFDDLDNQFFEFQTDGTARSLSVANRPLTSSSLAFNGVEFIMFDQDDVAKTKTLVANPDTGEVVDGLLASQRLPVEGLFHGKRGDVAYRYSLIGSELIQEVNFGLAVPATSAPRPADHPTVINEIMLDFLLAAGTTDEDQYLEFRGAPGGQLNPDTYFVIVEEQDNGAQGEIHGIFDLSDQPLGANGFLVLLQQGNNYQVDPDSALLESNAPGFGGLPGGIYTDSHPLSNHIDFIVGANSYFLIESAVAPQLGDDIDVDDDGFADPGGVKSNWNILDSISLHPDVFSGSQAYGQILLAEEDLGQDPQTRFVEPGTPIVITDGFGYAGRIGDSVGSDADDWVFGTPTDAEQDANGRTTLFELESGFFGHPTPLAFSDRDLDHLGDSNFVGGVRGVIELAPGLGATDPMGNPLPNQPAAGLTVLADLNANGVQDTIRYIADPDFVVDPLNRFDVFGNEIRYPLSNAFPGVTITAADEQNEPFYGDVETGIESDFFRPTNNYLFTSQGIFDTFDGFRRLRFDFYNPVSEASIEAIGFEFGLLPTFARIEAYDVDGNLIDEQLSGLLAGQRRETITVSSSNADISYVVAYGDDSLGSSFGARFDRLTYMQPEASAVTDANGQFEIKNLFPGIYDISVLNDANSDGLIGGVPRRILVSEYENFIYNEVLRPNVSPVVDPTMEFTTDENASVGSTVGFVMANDLDRQQLQYEIIGQDSGLLIDQFTGEITVGPDADLNFEEASQILLNVGVSDSIDTELTQVTIHLNDLNEAPEVEEALFFVAEDTENGTSIGQIAAVDPDFSQVQQLLFQITGGSGQGIFAINPNNGLITLVDETAINFEDLSELVLDIRVSDSSNPPLSTDISQRIRVIDQNDLPEITTDEFFVDENSMGMVGVIDVDDPDVGQTHLFELRGGTGAPLFEVTRTGEVYVRDGATLDFEGDNAFTLEVTAVDSGAPPLAVTKLLAITLVDVNEPPELSDSSAEVLENSPAGTPVTTLVIVDPENRGADYTVELLDEGDAAHYAFDPATKSVTVAAGADLDFETMPVHHLVFEIVDPTNLDPPTEVALTVNLLDGNDAPIVLTDEVVVSELAAPGTVVGMVEVQVLEPDNGDQVTVAIVGGNASEQFDLNPDTRVLSVADGAKFDADGRAQPIVALSNFTPNLPTTDTSGRSYGWVFEPIVDIQIESLGLFDAYANGAGFVSDHEIGIWVDDVQTKPLVASTEIMTTDTTNAGPKVSNVGEFRFKELNEPVMLSANVRYVIGMTTGNDPFYPNSGPVSSSSHFANGFGTERVSSGAALSLLFPNFSNAPNGYFGPNFTFTVLTEGQEDIPEPPLTIDVEVTDQGGLSSVQTIDVILNNVNEPPIFLGQPPSEISLTSGDPLEFVIPSDSIVDPEGRPFSLAIFDANETLPEWMEFDETTRSLSGIPTPEDVGTYPLTLRAYEPGPLDLFTDVTFTVVVEMGDTPLTNKQDNLDVDANGVVSPIDALRIINYMERFGAGSEADPTRPFHGFVDTNADGFVTAGDALKVINGLKRSTGPLGEQINVADLDEREKKVDTALNELLSESSLF